MLHVHVTITQDLSTGNGGSTFAFLTETYTSSQTVSVLTAS